MKAVSQHEIRKPRQKNAECKKSSNGSEVRQEEAACRGSLEVTMAERLVRAARALPTRTPARDMMDGAGQLLYM